MFRGGEASDGASPPKGEGEVHNGTLPWGSTPHTPSGARCGLGRATKGDG